MNYLNFREIKGYKEFVMGAHMLFARTLGNFFSASVRWHFEPFRELKQVYNINIADCIERNVYILSSELVLLISHVNVNDNSYILGVVLEGKGIGEFKGKKIFTYVASSLSNALQDSYKSRFRGAVIVLNEDFILRTISKYVSAGSYDSYKIYYIIRKFNSLRTTTFEGKNFSTGLIITKSLYNYKKQQEKIGASGELHVLRRPCGIYDDIENRFWYLIDGHSTFYLSDMKDVIRYVFVYNDLRTYDVHRFSESGAIIGRDVMLRTEGGRELSLITSKGVEFIYQENTWRYRDYKWLQEQIEKVIHIDDDVFDAVIHYVLYCSKSDISSILWIPSDVSKMDNIVSNKHSLFYSNVYLQNQRYEGLFKRFLSSDGATAIGVDGKLLYYGCLAKLNASQSKNPKGTGESAAALLAKNGIAFKVSQDGTIKIFIGSYQIKF